MFFGNRLKEARLLRGMSQKEVGDLIGVSKVTICGYEKGNKVPSLEVLSNIVVELNLSPNYLLGYDVDVIAEEEEEYKITLSKDEIMLINEIRKDKVLHSRVFKDTKRTVKIMKRNTN